MITRNSAPDDHRRFMSEAIRLSVNKMMDNNGGPFGAVIVRDGEIVSQGFNCVTSLKDPTVTPKSLRSGMRVRSLIRFSYLTASCLPVASHVQCVSGQSIGRD